MNKNLVVVAALAVLSVFAVSAADPVEGYWKSVDDKTGLPTAYWKIYDKGGVLFGEILRIVDKPDDTIATAAKPSYKGFPVAGEVNKMRVVGTPWIYGLSRKKAGEWADGSIIDPKTGDLYKCKITFRPADGKKFTVETLEMRGEIGLGIGRSQFWQRASEAEFR